MPSVMQAEDVARGAGGRFRAIFCAPLNVRCDRLHALNQPLRRFLPPIAGDQRPHHRSAPECAGCRDDLRISKSIRRTEPLWRRAGRIGNCLLTQAQFRRDLRRREPEEIRMRVRVVAQYMASGYRFLHQGGAFSNESANQEKSGLRVIAVQQIQQLWGDRRIWPVIESDGQLAWRMGAADRWSEKLRARVDST